MTRALALAEGRSLRRRRGATTILVASLIALALAFALPAAGAARDPLALPADYGPVARAWVESARADLALESGAWTPDVERILDLAATRAAEGRVLSAGQDVVTARVAMAFHPLWAEVESVDGETGKRGLVTSQTEAWNVEAERESERFRARLMALEDNLTSLLALEAALYAADWAAEANYDRSVFPTFKEEIPTENFDAGLVLGLTAVTHGAAWKHRLAADLLGPAEAREGLAPRYNATRWSDLTTVARTPSEGFVPPPTRPYEDLILATAERDEDVLAVAAFFGVLRAERVTGVQAQFGDAATRGIAATRDLADNVNRSLDAPALRSYEDLALEGLLVRSGADQANYVFEHGQYEIAYLARAWIGIEHARTLVTIFDDLSPVRNATVNGEPADGPATGLVVGIGAGVAVAAVAIVAWRSRRGGRGHRKG